MKHYTINEMIEMKSKSDEPKSFNAIISKKKSKNKQGEWIVCDCGSVEFFFAPIVNLRCAKCIKPL